VTHDKSIIFILTVPDSCYFNNIAKKSNILILYFQITGIK